MCTTKKPKPQAVPQDANKPVQYLTNPWVDGLGIVGADARGRNSLRIDRGSSAIRAPISITPAAPPGTRPTPTPGYGGGLGINSLPSYKLAQLGLLPGSKASQDRF